MGLPLSVRLLVATAAAALAYATLSPTAVGAQSEPVPPPEWNIAMVGGPAAGSATIAVVDSGVDSDHYAFGGPGNDRVLPGIDFVDGDADPEDHNGHGTHVAGIAAGGGIDCGGPTAIGVAPDAKILPVRVLDASGEGTMDDVIAGIDYAVEKGADIINLSLGEVPSLLGLGDDAGPFLAALTDAWKAGSIPVLAAGNNGSLIETILFPGGYGDVDAVVVTAVTDSNVRAGYAQSASSARWGIAAPGGDESRPILSSLHRQQCGEMAGTSMAAPHVSGALAVLRSRGLTPQEAVDRLLETAAPSGPGTGAGLVDIHAALVGLPAPESATTTTTVPATTTTAPAATTTTAAPATTTADTVAAPADSSTTTSGQPEVASADDTVDDSPALPLDDDPPPQASTGLTIVSDAEEVPGGVTVVAAVGVALAWLAWLGVLRRQFF